MVLLGLVFAMRKANPESQPWCQTIYCKAWPAFYALRIVLFALPPSQAYHRSFSGRSPSTMLIASKLRPFRHSRGPCPSHFGRWRSIAHVQGQLYQYQPPWYDELSGRRRFSTRSKISDCLTRLPAQPINQSHGSILN